MHLFYIQPLFYLHAYQLLLILLFLSQPVGGQQREKEVISVYLDATFSEKQSGEGHSHSVKSAACVETAQTTSR